MPFNGNQIYWAFKSLWSQSAPYLSMAVKRLSPRICASTQLAHFHHRRYPKTMCLNFKNIPKTPTFLQLVRPNSTTSLYLAPATTCEWALIMLATTCWLASLFCWLNWVAALLAHSWKVGILKTLSEYSTYFDAIRIDVLLGPSTHKLTFLVLIRCHSENDQSRCEKNRNAKLIGTE